MTGFFLGILTTIIVLTLSILLFYLIKIKPVMKKVKETLNDLKEPPISLQKTNYGLGLKSIDGWNFDFNSAKDKVIFLNFWATWCGPCRAEMPSLQNLFDQIKDNPNILFFLVSRDEDRTKVKKFMDEYSYTMPVYFVEGELPVEFDSKAIPATFVINKNGEIVLNHIGVAKWDSKSFVDFIKALAIKI